MCLRLLQGRLQRGIYDTIQTAVDTIFVGRDRQCNRRFLRMSSHHLVDPVACTPASGLGRAAKRINGQVENQVGLVRERFFTPRPRFKIYDELNVWVKDKCIADVKTHAHPEQPDTTIWAAFGEERPHLMPCRGRSDGFHALPASVSRTCLGRFDNNKCSVCASAVGRPVEIQAYADRMVIRLNGRVVLNGHIVAEHARCRGRGETVYDPWHYVPVLAHKPGALRNGAPVKRWVLAAALGAGVAQTRAQRCRPPADRGRTPARGGDGGGARGRDGGRRTGHQHRGEPRLPAQALR